MRLPQVGDMGRLRMPLFHQPSLGSQPDASLVPTPIADSGVPVLLGEALPARNTLGIELLNYNASFRVSAGCCSMLRDSQQYSLASSASASGLGPELGRLHQVLLSVLLLLLQYRP